MDHFADVHTLTDSGEFLPTSIRAISVVSVVHLTSEFSRANSGAQAELVLTGNRLLIRETREEIVRELERIYAAFDDDRHERNREAFREEIAVYMGRDE